MIEMSLYLPHGALLIHCLWFPKISPESASVNVALHRVICCDFRYTDAIVNNTGGKISV